MSVCFCNFACISYVLMLKFEKLMKHWYLLFLLCLAACAGSGEKEREAVRLWYDEPAANWNEALPIGNGRLGAMVFGGTAKEHLQLNENTLYSGEPSTMFKDIRVTPAMKERVVALMKAGEYGQASDLICKHWLGRLHQYYQPFGDLYITDNRGGEASAYTRELNLSEAVNRTVYTAGGATVEREVFASHPDDVIVIRLKTDSKEVLPQSLPVSINGKVTRVNTYGELWSALQQERFGSSASPYQIILSPYGEPVSGAMGYNDNAAEYFEFLLKALNRYRKQYDGTE